jgi:hypothetical protein
MKRDVYRRRMHEFWCDETLKGKGDVNEVIVHQRTPIINWRVQKKIEIRQWAQIELEEEQMRAGNLNDIKLSTIVCIQDEFVLYLYPRTHQVSSNMIVEYSNG